jgi:hypothetical protein
MSARTVVALIAMVGILATSFYAGVLLSGRSQGGGDDVKRDFMFQVAGYQTANQGGQTMNIFIHYRYNAGIATEDIPNYVDLRTQVVDFLDNVDASLNPYWETLSKQICTQLKSGFPIEAISCQFQVLSDDRPGLPYEPGFHTSIHTIGDIDPLAIPGPIGSPDPLSPSETLQPTVSPSQSPTAG